MEIVEKIEYASYPVSQMAKEIGFNLPTQNYWHAGKVPYRATGPEYRMDKDAIHNWNDGQGCYPTMASEVLCSCPTLSGIHQWIREQKGLDVNCLSYASKDRKRKYFFNIEKFVNDVLEEEIFTCLDKKNHILFDTYELALDHGCGVALKYLLKEEEKNKVLLA